MGALAFLETMTNWSIFTPDRRMKLCGGALHLNGGQGTFVPVEEFSPVHSTRRPGLYRRACRSCSNYELHGGFPPGSLVALKIVQPIYLELEKRVGREEAARRLGFGNSAPFRNVVLGRAKYVRRRNAEAAVKLLAELRCDNVWFDVGSIKRGALARGEQAKPPRRIYKAGTLQKKNPKGEKHPNFKKRAA